eukprot:scaffold54520_cov36-Tisochrysis_lutea.AAC.3
MAAVRPRRRLLCQTGFTPWEGRQAHFPHGNAGSDRESGGSNRRPPLCQPRKVCLPRIDAVCLLTTYRRCLCREVVRLEPCTLHCLVDLSLGKPLAYHESPLHVCRRLLHRGVAQKACRLLDHVCSAGDRQLLLGGCKDRHRLYVHLAVALVRRLPGFWRWRRRGHANSMEWAGELDGRRSCRRAVLQLSDCLARLYPHRPASATEPRGSLPLQAKERHLALGYFTSLHSEKRLGAEEGSPDLLSCRIVY